MLESISVVSCQVQFEMKRLGIDKTLPVGVVQWAGMIAINYPARKFGITRHMSFEEVRLDTVA